MKALKSFFSFPLFAYFFGASLGVIVGFGISENNTLDVPPCPLVHCTPEDTMRDLSVQSIQPGEQITITYQETPHGPRLIVAKALER